MGLAFRASVQCISKDVLEKITLNKEKFPKKVVIKNLKVVKQGGTPL